MKKNNNRKRKAILKNTLWILLFIGTPNLIAFLFQGSKLFSSFSYYITYTLIGYAYGIAFGLGNWLLGKYTGKLDWAKNPKRTNLISFVLFIGYGIIMSVMIPYINDVYLWGMTGEDVFYDVSAKAFMTIVADLIIFYFYYSDYITKHWMKSVKSNEELKRENLLSKYEALKNQVNPHFLFNSLNTLSGIVEQKPELATDFIKKLSDIYRYVLEQSDKQLVSIHNEMKFVEDYIFLSKMRFGESLVFKPALLASHNILIVPLGLQMLIENAIKHNVISDKKPLKIEMGIEDGFIVVKNNLQKKNVVNSGIKPMGLENLRKRYVFLSNTSLEVIESAKEFFVKLPIIVP